MNHSPRTVCTVKKGYELTSLIGEPLEHGELILVEPSGVNKTSLCFYRDGEFSTLEFHVPPGYSALPLVKAKPASLPVELDGWSVIGCAIFPEFSQESLHYQLTLAFDGLPAVYAKNDGHGGSSLIMGIGSPGSKHQLIEAFHQIFSRITSDGLVSEADAALIGAYDELFMDAFLEPLRRGYYLILPFEQCVAHGIRQIADVMRDHGKSSS